jgi:hypothetical protein
MFRLPISYPFSQRRLQKLEDGIVRRLGRIAQVQAVATVGNDHRVKGGVGEEGLGGGNEVRISPLDGSSVGAIAAAEGKVAI